MRYILTYRAKAASRAWFTALVLIGAWAPAQSCAYADAVNDLRIALLADQKQLVNPLQQIIEYRQGNLQKKVDSLNKVGELWGALALKEWKDDLFNVSPRIRAIDSDARRQVGLRLTKAIDDAVNHGDATQRLAAANSIAEKGPTIRSLSSTAVGDKVVMGDAGGFVRTLTPQVIRLAEDKNLGVRQEALRALGNIFPKPQQVVPVFKNALVKDAPGPRRLAATGLGQLLRVVSHLTKQERTSSGVEANRADVLDTVVDVLGANSAGLADDDAQIRALCLQNIKEAAEALGGLIKEPRKDIGTLQDTKDIPPHDRPVTPIEKKLILVNHEEISREINDFLPALSAVRAQQQALARSIKDPDSRVRLAAADALETIGNARIRLKKRVLSVPVVEASGDFGNRDFLVKNDLLESFIHNNLDSIAKLLVDPNVDLRRKGVEFLDVIEDAAAPALPWLVKRLNDPDKFVRWSAARAFTNFTADQASAAVPGLAKLLSDPDLDIRLTAAKTLAEMGPAAQAAVPALATALTRGDTEARVAAMEALQRIGADAGKAAVPQLIEAMGNADARVRSAAAKTLGSYGPAAFAAIPTLRRALGDQDQDVRVNASDAILDILRHREKD